jgi:Holliday junction resolvase RusA-like endonuclease
VRFYCPKPQKPSNPYPLPDIDNLEKAIFDSLNGWAWVDDKQICKLESEKFYAREPRIEIEWREHHVEPACDGIPETRRVSKVRKPK